jgi:hypothetical protein
MRKLKLTGALNSRTKDSQRQVSYFALARTKYASIPIPNIFEAIPNIGRTTALKSHMIE